MKEVVIYGGGGRAPELTDGGGDRGFQSLLRTGADESTAWKEPRPSAEGLSHCQTHGGLARKDPGREQHLQLSSPFPPSSVRLLWAKPNRKPEDKGARGLGHSVSGRGQGKARGDFPAVFCPSSQRQLRVQERASLLKGRLRKAVDEQFSS